MSKLGLHISAGPHDDGKGYGLGDVLKQCAAAGSPVPVIFALDQNIWPDVVRFSPQTVLIFRTQKNAQGQSIGDGPGSMYKSDPVQTARAWMAQMMPVWALNPAHYYAPLNEQDPATIDDFKWINAFTIECLNAAEANGYKLALYAFSSGNPKNLLNERGEVLQTPRECWRELIPSLRQARTNGHILLLHEYGLSAESKIAGVPNGTLRASAPYLALRYRGVYADLPAEARPPLVISEASAGIGYAQDIGDALWLSDVRWYDAEISKDPQVIGCCLYQLGGAENFARLLRPLAEYIAAAPPPPPPIAQRTYERVVHLVPPNVPTDADGQGLFDPRYLKILKLAGPGRESVLASADDAFIAPPQCTQRTVYVYNVEKWGGRELLEDWVLEWYPPLPTIVYREVA